MTYPLVVITHRVMFKWPPFDGVSLLIDNYFGRWSLYGPAMYPSKRKLQ